MDPRGALSRASAAGGAELNRSHRGIGRGPMNYRTLGGTGLKVSEISLGSWTTYGGSVDEADAVPIIHRAFERGVNLFDTADVYVRGGAERALGAALKSLPRE